MIPKKPKFKFVSGRFICGVEGFTLIELLVVISIIGLLASVVLVAVNGTRQKAKVAKVNADLQQIVKGIELSRDSNNQIMAVVTGSYWTAGIAGCTGYPGVKIMLNLPASDPCFQYLNTQFQKLGFPKAPIDPWGSPYTFDENERESGNCSSPRDGLSSAGPDGIYGTSDDYAVNIPYFQCP